MIKIILNLFLLLFSIAAMSQNTCLRLDSVKFTYIPFPVKTVYPIAKNEVLFGRTLDIYRKTRMISDDLALNQLSSIELNDSSLLIKDNHMLHLEYDLDVRGVLIYYLENSFTDTLVFDKLRCYTKNDNYYKQNYRLMLWVNEYGFYSQDKVYTNQGSSILKRKHDFLLETLEERESGALPREPDDQ